MFTQEINLLWRRKKTLIIFLLIVFICYEKTSLAWNSCDKEEIKSQLDNYHYVVVIASAPSNYARRTSIRNSWIKLAEDTDSLNMNYNHRLLHLQKIKFYFVIGTAGLEQQHKQKIIYERNEFDDVLLFDFQDSYSALTSKMLLTIKWIHKNMKGLQYLIKCDDDSFLRINLILDNLEQYAPAMNAPEISQYISHQEHTHYKGLYWGYFNGRATVFKKGKWKETKWILCDHYLPYALGGAYVISHNIVDFIARNADDLSQYNSEDVSMGVWTASLDGINRVHDLRFDTEATSRGCLDDMLVRHKVSADKMIEIYQTLQKSQGKKICNGEDLTSYYLYDWAGPPSKCCNKIRPDL